MKKNKGLLTLVGFLLAGLGFISLALNMIGLQYTFLTWMDKPGPLFGFLTRVLLVVVGIALAYLAQSDFKGEEL